MDLSLVLASQNIASEIQEENGRHFLIVDSAVASAAVELIAKYDQENRSWKLRQRISGVLFDWAALSWVMLELLFFALDAKRNLRETGMMDSTLLGKGQWWRLFTAQWLHADAGHLAANLGIGGLLLGLAMAQLGTGCALAGACIAGAFGNVFAAVLSAAPHRSLGASSTVMGMLGLLSAFGLVEWRQQNARSRASNFTAGVFLFVLFGLTPGTDILAHAGGFLGGLMAGFPLIRLKRLRGANLMAFIAFTVMTILPWWMALRKP